MQGCAGARVTSMRCAERRAAGQGAELAAWLQAAGAPLPWPVNCWVRTCCRFLPGCRRAGCVLPGTCAGGQAS